MKTWFGVKHMRKMLILQKKNPNYFFYPSVDSLIK